MPDVEITIYVQYPDGSIAEITGVNSIPQVPEGAWEITREEYERLLAEYQAGYQQDAAKTREAETEAKRTAYRDLVTSGVPETTASLLTGHSPAPER